MGLTRNNIANDLNISPFKLEVDYEEETLCFVFSSELYMKKFYERFVENREKICESLSNRFGFEIANEILCDLKLYTTIEKRGFLIIKGQEKIQCVNDIILSGGKMTKKN